MYNKIELQPSKNNSLEFRGNYSATVDNMKLVHWPLMGGLLHLVQRGWAWGAGAPPSPLLAVPNVTAHPSTASVPITVLLYNSPLLPRWQPRRRPRQHCRSEQLGELRPCYLAVRASRHAMPHHINVGLEGLLSVGRGNK